MKLMRYTTPMLDPVGSFADLREEINRLFGYPFPAFQRSQSFWTSTCPVNLYREDDGYVLRAEVPGFDKKNLSLEVVDGSLILSGRANSDEKSGEDKSETRFTRTVPLPDEVNASQIKAEYADGILTVTLPKRTEAKPRQIAIEVK